MNKLGIAYIFINTIENNISDTHIAQDLMRWVNSHNKEVIEHIQSVVDIFKRRVFITQLQRTSNNHFLYVFITDEELFLLKLSNLLNNDPECYLLSDDTKLWIPKNL